MTTFNQNFNNLVTATLQADDQQIKIEPETEINSKNDRIVGIDESAKSQDLFQDNKAVKVKYTTTRIKSRNFLSNRRLSKEDYYDKNFIFYVYLLLTKKLNPFLS